MGVDQQYWVFLFEDFVSQKEPIKQWARIRPVEDALVLRLQELDGGPTYREEQLAISMAWGRLLEIKRSLARLFQE